MPNAHWSEAASFSAATRRGAVRERAPCDFPRATAPARFPLCATATKSKVPSRASRAGARREVPATSERRPPPMGVIAPTRFGTMSTSSRARERASARAVSAFNRRRRRTASTPSRKGANAPDAASSTPTRSLGHAAMSPRSSQDAAMAAKREPGVAVKYWVEWSKETARPRSSVVSRVDALRRTRVRRCRRRWRGAHGTRAPARTRDRKRRRRPRRRVPERLPSRVARTVTRHHDDFG